MRILYCHRIQSRDGQSVHLDELVAALRRSGHEVLVVGPRLYAEAEFGGESGLVQFVRARLPTFAGELAEIAYNLPAYVRLLRAARAFRPEIIYERYNLFFVAGALLARGRRLPYYVEVNSPLADERSRTTTGLALVRLARLMERFVWRSATRVVAVTSVLAETLASQGAPRERLQVVPNGIDLAAFAAIPPRPEAPPRIVLGFIGFMRPWHGLADLLEALARHGDPRIDLLIVGEGETLGALKQQAAQLGLGARVRFTGLAAREAIPDLLAQMDIAMQPRAVAYASPLKLFEYMAAGRAIVAPDQPNIREILEHERTALLFAPGDTAAMWRAIARLVADDALRRRLAEAARDEIARRDYTWDGNARRLIEWAGEDMAGSASPAGLDALSPAR